MLQHEAIKSYLEKAVPKCLSLKKQINICDELTCHIQDKADFYIEIGYDEEKSYEKALEEMGDGEEVCRQFEDVYQEKTIHAVLTSIVIHFADFFAVILGFGGSFFSLFANGSGMLESSESILFSSVTLCVVLILIIYAHKERHSKMLKAIGISHLIMTFLTGVLNSIYSPLIIAVITFVQNRFSFYYGYESDLFGPIIISFPIGFICLILSKSVKYKKGLSEKAFKTLTALFVAGLVIVNCFNFTFNYSSISDYITKRDEIENQTEVYENITSDMTFEQADKFLKDAGYVPSTELADKDKDLAFSDRQQSLKNRWSLSDNNIIYNKYSSYGEINHYDHSIVIPYSQTGTIAWKIFDFDPTPYYQNVRILKNFTIASPDPVDHAQKLLNSFHIGDNKADCIQAITKSFSFFRLKSEFDTNFTETYGFYAVRTDSIGNETLHIEAELTFKNNRLSKGSYVLTHTHQEIDDMGICFDVEEKEEHIIK